MENTTTFTKENLVEYLKCQKDPIYFIKKYFTVQHPIKGAVKLDLYTYQENVIRAYENNQHNIALTSRQVGISATSCAYVLWYAMFHDDKTVLTAGDTGGTSREIIYRIKYAYDFLPDWFKSLVVVKEFYKHSIEFDNGSRIISQKISPECGCGMAISLLYVDSMAFVDPDIQEEFWTSVLPTLALGASSIITSVPNSSKDRFALLWRQAIAGENSFNPISVDWQVLPDRDDKFKEDCSSRIGERKWRQEYECEFMNPKKYQG